MYICVKIAKKIVTQTDVNGLKRDILQKGMDPMRREHESKYNNEMYQLSRFIVDIYTHMRKKVKSYSFKCSVFY